MSNGTTFGSRAERYLYSINPLARRIGEDIAATKEAYEGLWNTLTVSERNQAINETIIQPEVALRYTLAKVEKLGKDLPDWYPKLRIQTGMKYVIDETGSTLRWRDEHSAPFSFMTQSQMNLDLVDASEDSRSKCPRSHFADSPRFPGPGKARRIVSTAACTDGYPASRHLARFPPADYPADILEDERCDESSNSDIDDENDDDDDDDDDRSPSIFAKLINKTSLLKLQNDLTDDMESLVRERDSDTDQSRSNALVIVSSAKSSDVNESTALLETPSSYSSFQSSHLNQEDEERSIPKTGFEFLDNW
ncbi:hypothetical protein KM043_000456 [Ampulex compressa]|nr:hypothetical protein KM043_000456 [Ampulex compressa]